MFAEKQLKKSGLSPSVPSRKPQFPIGINLKIHVLEDVIVGALIGKSKAGNIN
ncbi:hypothetical protein D3C86_1788130 [compost metagenome]